MAVMLGQYLPSLRPAALTATATPIVQEDVSQQLGLTQPTFCLIADLIFSCFQTAQSLLCSLVATNPFCYPPVLQGINSLGEGRVCRNDCLSLRGRVDLRLSLALLNLAVPKLLARGFCTSLKCSAARANGRHRPRAASRIIELGCLSSGRDSPSTGTAGRPLPPGSPRLG